MHLHPHHLVFRVFLHLVRRLVELSRRIRVPERVRREVHHQQQESPEDSLDEPPRPRRRARDERNAERPPRLDRRPWADPSPLEQDVGRHVHHVPVALALVTRKVHRVRRVLVAVVTEEVVVFAGVEEGFRPSHARVEGVYAARAVRHLSRVQAPVPRDRAEAERAAVDEARTQKVSDEAVGIADSDVADRREEPRDHGQRAPHDAHREAILARLHRR
mmetsp:Transcript_12914/g.50527  ORF Transcript_12914/g.50527 Transcript_12914/m.50527 type:complete len:218 (-) Transcript_12914:65-718(-)